MFSFQKFLPIIIVAFLSFAFTGCGNPTVNVLMKCTDDSNGSNAVRMKLYQLRSSEKFELSSRESLLRSTQETLGEDLIPNTKVEKIMIPGETFNIEDIELTDETKFIGVVGDFFLPVRQFSVLKPVLFFLADAKTGIFLIILPVVKKRYFFNNFILFTNI